MTQRIRSDFENADLYPRILFIFLMRARLRGLTGASVGGSGEAHVIALRVHEMAVLCQLQYCGLGEFFV